MSAYCCSMMEENARKTCKQHKNPFECPDIIIVETIKGFGIIIHDGMCSYIQIQYCPWCGSILKELEGND